MQLENGNFHLVSQHLVMQADLNPKNYLFGGELLAWLDKDTYIHAATSLGYKNLVTASLDQVVFKNPAFAGEIIRIYSSLLSIRRSLVKCASLALAFDPQSGQEKTIIHCQISYVALNEAGKVVSIPDWKKIQASLNLK